MKKEKKENKICRSFRQDFPEFVERAEALGVRISLSRRRDGGPRTFWLDGYLQLTGYTTRADGLPFTHDDAVKNIDKRLSENEEGRKELAAMSTKDRFSRVISEMRKIVPQYRMIGEVHLPSGDNGHCFFMSSYDGGINLHEIGVVAKAKAEWRIEDTSVEQLARFCDALEDDFNHRNAGRTKHDVNGNENSKSA